MTINSWTFLLFAAAAVLLVRSVSSEFVRKLAILIFSLVFVGTYLTTGRAVITLLLVLIVIYALGHPRIRAILGWAGTTATAVITVLWAFLFLLKDPNLFGPLNPFRFAPIVIVGISYIVFRGISYLMEAESAPRASFLDFLNYMLFFPTLLAGPIERYREFTPVYARSIVNGDAEPNSDVLPALHRIANGVLMKFVLADNLAVFGIGAVADPTTTPVAQLWVAPLVQLALIFLDFAGYTNIAIGLAALMGIKLRENFDKPLLAANIQQFWERWHMSMSSLMRDYVFTPICRMIYTSAPRERQWPLVVGAYCTVMMLIALWHGTTTGFLVFGLLHGTVLVAIQYRQSVRSGPKQVMSTPQRWMWITLTYLFVSFTMVLWMRPGATWIAYYRAMVRGLLP